MKLELHPKHPPAEPINVTTVYSREFADLLREIRNKREIERMDGSFSIYAEKKRLVLELEFRNK